MGHGRVVVVEGPVLGLPNRAGRGVRAAPRRNTAIVHRHPSALRIAKDRFVLVTTVGGGRLRKTPTVLTRGNQDASERSVLVVVHICIW